VDKWNDDERSSNPKNLEKCRELPTRFAGSDGSTTMRRKIINLSYFAVVMGTGCILMVGALFTIRKLKYEGFVRH
jgi:hypothetical protein